MNKKNLQEMVEGVIYGTAVYDALGLPPENKTEEQIKNDLPGVDQKFMAAGPHHIYMPNHQPGEWSDDTELTIAVATGIVKAKAIDLTSIANEHVLAGDKYQFIGWGGATRGAAKFLKENGPENYQKSGKVGALGNGALMKMAPLAIAMESKVDQQGLTDLQLVEKFTRMTHDTSMAVVCSAVHADVLRKVLRTNGVGLKTKEGRLNFLKFVLDRAINYEAEFGIGLGERVLSKQCKSLLDNFDGLSENSNLIAISNGGGCLAPDTLTMVYGLLVADNLSIEAAHRGVRIGGDTDSNASITAGMVCAIEGIKVIPKKLVKAVNDRPLLDKTAKDFTNFLTSY